MIKKISIALQKNGRILLFFYLIGICILLQYVFGRAFLFFNKALMNCLFVLPILGFLLLIFPNYNLAFVFHSLVLFIVYFIDETVYRSRLTHIRYSDFFAIDDGFRVLDKYSISLNLKDVSILLSLIFLNVMLLVIRKKLSEKEDMKEKKTTGLVIVFGSLLYIIAGTYFSWIEDPVKSIDDNFDYNGYVDREGLHYAIYGQFLHSRIEKPKDYDERFAQSLLEEYSNENNEFEPTDIIIIMNEAFTDYSLIGNTDFLTDPLVNIHDKENNYFEGKLAVSVFGGYTCNTEFEFLTGASMRFFPEEYIPFTQLVTREMPSIAWDLNQSDIKTEGIHPYYSQEWNRKSVYRFLGFENFIAGEDFSSGLKNAETDNITDTSLKKLDFGDDLEYVRGFISDDECYRRVVASIDDDGSNFIFVVTVQNHGGYDYDKDDFQKIDFIEGNDRLNQYLTLTKISDNSFNSFIKKIKERNQRTLVVLFGDHQPGLDFSAHVSGFEYDDIFYVPYIVWSNFESDVQLPEITSTNYLSAILKEYACLPMTSWDRFRLEMIKEYPVISKHIILDKKYNRINKEKADKSDKLKQYELLQYYLFCKN